MKPRFPLLRYFALLTGGILLVVSHGLAQVASPEDPRWMRFRLPEISLGMEAEGLTENVSVGNSTSTHEQFSLIPLVGLRTGGSIYHPNLITFDLNGEAGWGWISDTFKSPGISQTRNESEELLRYLAQVSFLASKPYTASFVASRDHTYRNYDSFSTYTVDSDRYSGRASWTTATITLNADAGYRDERSTGISDVSEIAETYLNFTGNYKRPTGQTMLIYRYDEFENSYNLGLVRSSVNNSVSVSDSETFGSRRQGTATTGASYSQYEYSNQQTETITANENISIHHQPKLDSFLAFNFSHSRLNPVNSSIVQGTAGVRHRLYDSLTTTLDAHGSYDKSSSSTSSASNDRYGLGLHENYVKRLGDWGRLTLGAGIIADHEDHESSGSVLTTLDEKHQLYLLTSSSYRPAFLSQPRVISGTILVRGPGGIPAAENVDYQVIPTGELTEIRLILGSLVLHDGDEVLVSYQSRSLYNAGFESFNGTVQIRVDFLNRYGVYGRINWLDNNAPANALTETLTDVVFGMDYSWRWFRAGAEYEDYDSNFSKYQAWRFYQTFTVKPSDVSTLGVDFSESFYCYGQGSTQNRYQVIARYNSQLSFALAWYVEGGYSFQEVMGSEQNLGSARTGLSWSRGKLSFRTGYEYNYQTTMTGPSSEHRDRNYFFAHLKRSF